MERAPVVERLYHNDLGVLSLGSSFGSRLFGCGSRVSSPIYNCCFWVENIEISSVDMILEDEGLYEQTVFKGTLLP